MQASCQVYQWSAEKSLEVSVEYFRRNLTVSDGLTVYVLRTTHAMAQWLWTVRLLMCMDTEANPGPKENSNILQIMTWKFAQVMHGMQAYTMKICRKINGKWTNIDNCFRHFTTQVGELRHCTEENKEDIQDLQKGQRDHS